MAARPKDKLCKTSFQPKDAKRPKKLHLTLTISSAKSDKIYLRFFNEKTVFNINKSLSAAAAAAEMVEVGQSFFWPFGAFIWWLPRAKLLRQNRHSPFMKHVSHTHTHTK